MSSISASSSIEISQSGITFPDGFSAVGLHCGVRTDKKDLALLWSDTPASVAGVFTRNQVQAAPVLVCREQLRGGYSHGVVINSGNANACTGPQGLDDAWEMVNLTASSMGVEPALVMVCSTGLIGHTLPMDKIRVGIVRLKSGLSSRGGDEAAEAIMTTDAFKKIGGARVHRSADSFRIGGMAKGAGMVHPQLATTLGFLTTDASVEPALLQRALLEAIEPSWNSITVDGDTSTNDTVLLFANGKSGVKIEPGETYDLFVKALTVVATDLAKMVVRDGEGARRLVELIVSGAPSQPAAKRIAETIAGSLLFKTMLVGGEPNWGRVVAAAGRSGVEIHPDRLRLWMGDVQVVESGLGLPERIPEAAKTLQGREVRIRLDLGDGEEQTTVWTCDINENYVVLNGSYMT